MNNARTPQIRSDRSDRSDPFGILHLFRSEALVVRSDRSDRTAAPRRSGPTGPIGVNPTLPEISEQYQSGPSGPSGPTDEMARVGEALDSVEERASIREFEGGQTRVDAGAAALAEVARAAGMSPEALLGLWAAHPDARAYLAQLTRNGPQTYGAMASRMGWGATRAWLAEARLRAAGLITMGPQGVAVPATRAEGRT